MPAPEQDDLAVQRAPALDHVGLGSWRQATSATSATATRAPRGSLTRDAASHRGPHGSCSPWRRRSPQPSSRSSIRRPVQRPGGPSLAGRRPASAPSSRRRHRPEHRRGAAGTAGPTPRPTTHAIAAPEGTRPATPQTRDRRSRTRAGGSPSARTSASARRRHPRHRRRGPSGEAAAPQRRPVPEGEDVHDQPRPSAAVEDRRRTGRSRSSGGSTTPDAATCARRPGCSSRPSGRAWREWSKWNSNIAFTYAGTTTAAFGAKGKDGSCSDGVNTVTWARFDASIIAAVGDVHRSEDEHRPRRRPRAERHAALGGHHRRAGEPPHLRHPLDRHARARPRPVAARPLRRATRCGQTMMGNAEYGETRKRTLALGDIIGLQTAYPCGEGRHVPAQGDRRRLDEPSLALLVVATRRRRLRTRVPRMLVRRAIPGRRSSPRRTSSSPDVVDRHRPKRRQREITVATFDVKTRREGRQPRPSSRSSRTTTTPRAVSTFVGRRPLPGLRHARGRRTTSTRRCARTPSIARPRSRSRTSAPKGRSPPTPTADADRLTARGLIAGGRSGTILRERAAGAGSRQTRRQRNYTLARPSRLLVIATAIGAGAAYDAAADGLRRRPDRAPSHRPAPQERPRRAGDHDEPQQLHEQAHPGPDDPDVHARRLRVSVPSNARELDAVVAARGSSSGSNANVSFALPRFDDELARHHALHRRVSGRR